MTQLDENLIVDLVRRKTVQDTFRRLPSLKKSQVYDQAIKLFGVYGYDGLPVDRLCKESGISKGSFFQYFASKSHLLEFTLLCFDSHVASLFAQIRENERGGTARQKIRHLSLAIASNELFDDAEKRYYLFGTRALQHAAVAIEGIDLDRHLRLHLEAILSRGSQTGEIKAGIDTISTSEVITNVLVSMLMQPSQSGRMMRGRTGENLISLLFDGIRRN